MEVVLLFFLCFVLVRLFLSAFAPLLSRSGGSSGLPPPVPPSVAVVLVLDMWSVLGVAPFVSPQRVVVVVVNWSSIHACFFPLSLSPPTTPLSSPSGQQNLIQGEIAIGAHLKLTGLLVQSSYLGKLSSQVMLRLFKIFLGITLGVCDACSDQPWWY